MKGITGAVDQAERAEADARRLRGRYGASAEAWCASALAGLPTDDPRRESIRLIAKALRRLPVAETGPTSPVITTRLDAEPIQPDARP